MFLELLEDFWKWLGRRWRPWDLHERLWGSLWKSSSVYGVQLNVTSKTFLLLFTNLSSPRVKGTLASGVEMNRLWANQTLFLDYHQVWQVKLLQVKVFFQEVSVYLHGFPVKYKQTPKRSSLPDIALPFQSSFGMSASCSFTLLPVPSSTPTGSCLDAASTFTAYNPSNQICLAPSQAH